MKDGNENHHRLRTRIDHETSAEPSVKNPQSFRGHIDSANAIGRSAGLGLGVLSADGVFGVGLDCLIKKKTWLARGQPRQGLLELRLESRMNRQTEQSPSNHQEDHRSDGSPVDFGDFSEGDRKGYRSEHECESEFHIHFGFSLFVSHNQLTLTVN